MLYFSRYICMLCICNISAHLHINKMICRCSTCYVVALVLVIIYTCIQSYLFEFCFELPQCNVVIMVDLCAMYLQRYGSFAYVVGELWLSIDIYILIWQHFSLPLHFYTTLSLINNTNVKIRIQGLRPRQIDSWGCEPCHHQ
jgi:hypothetical protein